MGTLMKSGRFGGFILHQNQRQFWGWLNAITNKVDPSRIKEVGPDRAAAEWLLRCGAGVRWKGSDKHLTDYNSLAVGVSPQNVIEEIDGTDSCIMSVGFPHLKGLQHLKKMTLHRCNYLDNEALPMLAYVKNSLIDLQLSSCGNIDDEGVKSLECLTNLKYLLIYDLPEVRNKEDCVKHLKEAIPNCDIQFPYARPEEKKVK